jgi:hypothetical protein
MFKSRVFEKPIARIPTNAFRASVEPTLMGRAGILPKITMAGIEADKWRFWTSGGGKSVWVIIATHSGRKYLKTQPDGITPDNLLALPECP